MVPRILRFEATLVVEPPPEKGIDLLREVVALLTHQPDVPLEWCRALTPVMLPHRSQRFSDLDSISFS